jgi:hypothetical protein
MLPQEQASVIILSFFNNKVRFTLEFNHLANPIDQTTVAPDGQLGFVPTPYGAQSSIRFQAQFGF